MAFLLRGAFVKSGQAKFLLALPVKKVWKTGRQRPCFSRFTGKNIAAHLKILFIATLKSGSYNGNQMHVSCLRCSRKGMRLDDRKISKRKRRCNHEKQQANAGAAEYGDVRGDSVFQCRRRICGRSSSLAAEGRRKPAGGTVAGQLAPAARRGVLLPIRRGCSV